MCSFYVVIMTIISLWGRWHVGGAEYLEAAELFHLATEGRMLLVNSARSKANHCEGTCTVEKAELAKEEVRGGVTQNTLHNDLSLSLFPSLSPYSFPLSLLSSFLLFPFLSLSLARSLSLFLSRSHSLSLAHTRSTHPLTNLSSLSQIRPIPLYIFDRLPGGTCERQGRYARRTAATSSRGS